MCPVSERWTASSDDYMKWLSTTWKAQNQAAIKAGYLVSYQVLSPSPSGPDDPDLYLVLTYKNWAALDGALAKNDEIAKQIEGSVAASNQAQFERADSARTRFFNDAGAQSEVVRYAAG